LSIQFVNGIVYDGPTVKEIIGAMPDSAVQYINTETGEYVWEHGFIAPLDVSLVFNGDSATLAYSVQGKEFIWEMEIVSYTNDVAHEAVVYKLNIQSVNGIAPSEDVTVTYAAYYGNDEDGYYYMSYDPYFYPHWYEYGNKVELDGITYELWFEFLFQGDCVIWNEESTDPSTVSTMFTGEVVSNTGQYDLAIAGHFTGELLPGENVLTLAEIQANTISIVAHNNNTGTNRVMTQTTIEEMTVTVSGGRITSIYIVGRVQTPDGTLDRYSLTIPL